ncbi:unnamed protein product [Clonostachys byssicola]|uniref:DUF1746 domain-containing protein n=1 Tax=Clonostachys byssicola TaxID=160290 RepID=A0A9N9XTP3_9HYPO|nr:unnamed protein product [Clonostachys byssicola]
MNNDSPSTSAAPNRYSTDGIAGGAGLHHHQQDGDVPRSPGSRDGQRRRRKNRKKRNPGLKKKLAFVTHLLKGLDTVVLAELSALYYMECSLFRFLIRAAGQFVCLSPKDEASPFLLPASRIHVLLILVPNIWCMLMHLFGALPKGPDYHRGYLHGGLIFDFIGQKPPQYRIYYFMADLAILFLQCFMLTVHSEREKLRIALKTFRPIFSDPVTTARVARTIEELDAEEQGMQGVYPDVENEVGDVELQSLGRGNGETSLERRSDLELSGRPSHEGSRSHLADILNSGNAVIGEYHIVNTMRLAATELERTTSTSIQNIGTLAALEAERRGVTLPSRPGPTV